MLIVAAASLMCAACSSLSSVTSDSDTAALDGNKPLKQGTATELKHTSITGRPFKAVFHAPETARSDYPVVIDLHGCSGVHAEHAQSWRRRLAKLGIGQLVLDSFSQRGVHNVCADVFRVSPAERVLDVRAFLKYVESSPVLRRHSWFLMGFSHGGTTVLLSSLHPDPVFRRLRGMVAYYPWCLDALPYVNTDLLILIGGTDDWTPAARCRGMRVKPTSRDYELVIYPDATHSFDINGIDTLYYGHRLKHHPAAARDSVKRVLSFITTRR